MTFWIPYQQLNLFSCDPLQTAITRTLLCLQWSCVTLLIWIIMDSKSNVYDSLAYVMNIVSTQSIPTSPLLKSSVSAVTKHGAHRLQLMWTQTILPYAKIPTCLWNGNYITLPGISIFGNESPLPNASDLWNLWSYVFCKGVQMTIVADHLDNAGFNAIARVLR